MGLDSSVRSLVFGAAFALAVGSACGSNPSGSNGATPNGGGDQGAPTDGGGARTNNNADAAAAAGGDATAVGGQSDAAAAADGGAGGDGNDRANGDASTPVDPVAETMHVHADDAIETLMLNFWPKLRGNTTTYDWMYAHYWDAVLDATERRGPNAFSGTVRMFYELQEKRGWFDNFYDDEDWITLALLHSYKVTADPMYLNQAKAVFADIMKAWDTTCCGAHPGGLWWQKPTMDKATAINAGAVISASRLYQDTQDASYLAFAKKVYDYWSTYMVDASTGHVYDSISNSGAINTSWSFTYNEGLFIGAVVELAQATGDASAMPLAHKVAGYMMSHEIETIASGTILSDGHCGAGDGEMFKGVGARYLKELYEADTSHTEYRDFLQRSGDAAWNLARDPATGDISCDWKGPFDSQTGVVGSLGSAAIGLASAAEALGPGIRRPALVYEAEEGDLHGVNLEATQAGFSGWGYLAGWNADGQSVDLLVDAPSAGKYQLTWRYATPADAKRALSLNGQLLDGAVAFPSSGGYANYTTTTTTATLPEGHSVITLAFAAVQASAGSVNLDSLQLTPP